MDGSPGNLPAANRWAVVESLLHDALECDPAARGSFLDRACRDGELRREVDALLEAHARPGKLDALASRVMTPLLTPVLRSLAPGPAPAGRGPFDLPPIARYEVVERVGGGGMGVVYRARDERLGRDVALKFLPPHLSANAAAKKRFLVEARAAASLEHPNICTVHEIGETEDGQLYIVMGFYDGETLDRRIASGALPVEEALRIASDIALGLAKAHDRGIVHRDVKPANIMLTSDGIVKILDFGIAKLSDISVTQTHGVIGTLAYMSPEQAFGETVDARSDVWALGIVLHEMLTGSRPFGGPGEQAVLYAILTHELGSMTGEAGDVAPDLDALLRRALAKKPGDRFANAREMHIELGRVGDRVRTASESTARRPPRVSPAHGTGQLESLLGQAGERRHASLVVTGLADYPLLVERLAPADLDRVLAAVRDAAVEIATRYGGIVNHFAGDEAVLLFGVATSHEDDYLRAVRAALDLHERVRRLPAPVSGQVELRMRSGIHTGPVVAQRLRSGDRRFRLTGVPLDVTMRLASLAGSDAILASPECHRLVAPFVDAEAGGAVTLLPGAEAVTPYTIIGESAVQTRLESAERTGLTPYTGRARELGLVQDRLDAAQRGEGGLVVIIGEPGAGKSRLLHELRRRIDAADACMALGRCDAYGGNTPYMPFVQALREIAGITGRVESGASGHIVGRIRAIDAGLEDAIPLYCALLAISSAEYPLPRHLQGEHLQAAMLDALVALVTARARQQPVVLLLEDWHWADEASRAALQRLAEVAPTHALFIVVTSRPDPTIAWTAGDGRTLLQLGPLGQEAASEIMRGVLGATRVDPGLAQVLHDRTAGNPFFLEETCQALREAGTVTLRQGEAVADQTGTLDQLPETVQAVIRTRLDRLPSESRHALRVASVIGREFSRGVLEELAGPALDAGKHLEQLRAAGLIQQMSVAPEPVFRFKHVLTQEVAYDTLLEHQRRTLHAAAGRAIERRYQDRLDEHLERLAHHFSGAEEWAAAVHHGLRAADRSQSLSQFPDALAMLGRTRAWVERFTDEPTRREALANVLLREERLCETLGMRARQVVIVEELIALLAPHGGSAKLAEAYLRQGDVCTLLRRFDAADRALGTALRLSSERGDQAGVRNAARSIGLLRSHEGRYAEAVTSIEHALRLDVELGETRAAAGDVASLGNVLRKMGRQQDALDALEQALEYLTPRDDPTKWCAVMTVISAAHRDLGNVDKALEYLVRVRDESVERRLPIMASFSLPAIAHIQLQQGRTDEALATYRQAVDLSRRARHADGLAQSLRALGEVLFGLGQHAQAAACLREAADVFAQLEDRETETLLWERAASALERCGDLADAEQLWARVRERREAAGDARGDAAALEGIARCARHRGVRMAAIAHYEHALGRVITAGDLEREVALRNTLGLLRWEDGVYPEALRQYEVALRLCRELEDRVHEGLILNSLGATLLKLRRYDEARIALEEGAQTNARTGEKRLEGHSHSALGDVLLETGRAAEARLAFDRALALCVEVGDRRGEGRLLERRARALDAEGRAREALAAREEAAVVAQEMQDPVLMELLQRSNDPSDPVSNYRR